MRARRAAILLSTALLAVPPVPAQQAVVGPRPTPSAPKLAAPTAGEWQRSCEAYMQALQGVIRGDDMEVTYCLGLTLGLVEGMRLGSQLGALNFGSQLSVVYQLEPGEVFARFRARTADSLLQVCPPDGIGLRAYVTAVHGFLAGNPQARQRPVTEVFFEALQVAFPCGETP